MKPLSQMVTEHPWTGWVIFFATMLVVFLLGLLASAIMERRAEAVFAYTPQVKFETWEPRSAIWGENFPREYQSYLSTSDITFKSRYNGGAPIDMLETDPRLVVLWAGYAFSKDYYQGRGHYYAVKDIYKTLRTGAPLQPGDGPQPATCWTCKSPDVPRVMASMGTENFYKNKWAAFGPEIVNSVGCADCHDATTMNLHITRPALIEAIQRQGKDISTFSHQEMRSLVCAQCHVEYYFKGEGKYLTFPWDKGMTVEAMEQYYDTYAFTDWVHAMSKTPMLKAQHPDYELYTLGVHAKRGVSCADCHMPYISEGGIKYTSHKIQSPLNQVSNSCQVCHREETERLVEDVYERQDKIIENRDKLEILLVRAHIEAKTAWENQVAEQEMKPVLQLIRQAQWRWDFSAASHGASFHAPVEVSRIIASGIEKAQEARVLLARLLSKKGFSEDIPYPDISTKQKAQQFIGLDIQKLNDEKSVFLKTIVPQWLQEAEKRQSQYPVKHF